MHSSPSKQSRITSLPTIGWYFVLAIHQQRGQKWQHRKWKQGAQQWIAAARGEEAHPAVCLKAHPHQPLSLGGFKCVKQFRALDGFCPTTLRIVLEKITTADVQPKTNMNHTGKYQPTNQTTKPKQKFVFLHRPAVWLGSVGAVVTGIALLANAQQPVLKISDLGGSQFFIEITNAVHTNYTLYWTPALANPNYPWIVLTNTEVGGSNFLVDAGGWDTGWFRVLTGTDFDGDGIPEWMDAQPQNPSVGILSVTIDSPVNGTDFN